MQPELPIHVPRDVYLSGLRHNDKVGRLIRLDSPATQGVATQWFALSAFEDAEWELAWEYCVYERADYRRLAATVLGGWLEDLVAYVVAADWSGPRAADLVRSMRTQMGPRLEFLADQALEDLRLAIGDRNRRFFESGQRQLREAHIASNDLAVRMIQDLMTAVGEQEGDDAVLTVLDVSYQNIWKRRYAKWFELDAHERLALSSEGMRAHYSGPGRRGDFTVVERETDYLMVFDPCGTGQVMRRANDDRGAPSYLPVIAVGSTRTPAAWNQHTIGMPYYCAHCPALLEHFPLRDLTMMLRPVQFKLDPFQPCEWSIPKHLDNDLAAPVA